MKDDLIGAGETDLRESFDASSKPIVRVDFHKYQAFLDGADMTDAQKEEFIQALWAVIVSFVEMGFGVHPVQQACGKPGAGDRVNAKEAFDEVRSKKRGKDETTSE
ncbi:hypothetical protein RA27_10100 [Ruegeria sp. ANG-R]|uniref:hypothetical protein n=1 Tax=Ruegeria sp. ANG-R TaxID=1577903 RepID=UPI00057E65BE|nr:hypothetical protein [Ruegeria sp. ANG-R]KIC41579.1 hypothetical protein RA27_10100 [Ruegeria sp. ANG-R]